MKINKISISGYRGFDNFVIETSELEKLTIIAGQNGTGKSTILEVIAFLLNSSDHSQTRDPNILQGIKDKSMWELSATLEEKEIEYISQYISEKDPLLSNKKADIENRIKEDLIRKGKLYGFTVQLYIDREKLLSSPDEGVKFQFIGKGPVKNTVPPWFKFLQDNQIFLATYIKDLESIGEPTMRYLTMSSLDPESYKFATTGIDLRNRSTRTTLNVGSLLEKLALEDVWNVFRKNEGNFSELKRALETISEVAKPLEIEFEDEETRRGRIRFRVHNKKTNSYYPSQFISSGEKQVFGLTAMLLNWKRQPFKPIILIDEPDVHLHPEFVSRLASLFKNVFKNEKNYTCLIATHSPEFISENADNVYQISPNSEKINKVENLETRKDLLASLGKKFDLAYLSPRIVFVEGQKSNKRRLADMEVYQKLIDPNKNRVIFIPANDKSRVAIAAEFSNMFFDYISLQIGRELEIFALRDSDDEKVSSCSKTLFITPYNCLENLFLMDTAAISTAATFLSGTKKYTVSNIEGEILKILKEFGKNIMEIDGKEAFDKFYSNLKHKDIKINSKKALQLAILNEIDNERLPQSVKSFLGSLKKGFPK
jgi:AAA15 family ATPase/GTPase